MIGLLQRTDQLLSGFSIIAVLADLGLPSAELCSWLEGQSPSHYVMRLRSDTWVHSTAGPMGCEGRRLHLLQGHCRGFRDMQLWVDCSQRANLVLARPVDITASEA